MARRGGEKQPIRWTRHKVAVPPKHPLRMLAAPGTMADAPEVEIELPDLPTLPSPKEIAEFLLMRAAEVEHALLVQYLYAGYSLTQSPGVVTGIAVEEMWHLMTVQNLLLVLGLPPHLGRQDFGPPAGDEYRMFPFPLLLEPLTKASLAKYVMAESPENADTVDPVMAQVRQLALEAGGQPVNRVGTLYAFLGVVFGTEQILMQKAAEGEPWYQMVYRLAEVAAEQYGGRDKIHLPDADFRADSLPSQGTDEVWDRSDEDLRPGFRVHTAAHRLEALEALRDIGLQGEGPSQPGAEQSHFARFLMLFKTLFGTGEPASGLVRRVPKGAVIPVGPSDDPNAISHPETVRWAELANLRYALLLGFVEQYMVFPPGDRQFLAGWTFAEMFHLKWLGGHLATLPRSATVSAAETVAALPFTMPPAAELGQCGQPGAAVWPAFHAARLKRTIELCDALLPTIAANSDPWKFLTHVQQSDGRKLAEATARQADITKSVRTQFDQVREILDWAAGTGSPRHHGASPLTGTGATTQRRFWNLPLDQFKKVKLSGQVIVESVDGADPLLLEVLTPDDAGNAFMPLGRPALAKDGWELKFLAEWIKNRCPDAPLSDPPPAGSPPPTGPAPPGS